MSATAMMRALVRTALMALSRRKRLGRRGAVAIMFALSAIPMAIATGVAIDFSRIIAARSALQRAADNAALSGAAAYVLYTQTDSYNAVARNVATSVFCNATSTLPAGFTMVSVGGSACAALQGPKATAVIAGFRSGTRGTVTGSGCSPTNTVVSGITCGFVVTVSAAASMNSVFPALFGSGETVSVTASAINPFINLATVLQSSMKGSAKYANSLWVYPLLLDDSGSPDFTTNMGALPDTSACTSDPTQTVCGSYSMLASTLYASCTTATPCTVNGAVFGGAGGVVQNPASGAAVITATTPLGFALESTAGDSISYGYKRPGPYYGSATPTYAPDGCVWPFAVVYNTVTQIYYANGKPVLPWTLPTHWFYSSYLANYTAPSYGEIAMQTNTAINPTTGVAYNDQHVPPTPEVPALPSTPQTCANLAQNYESLVTTYPVTGKTNCSLYVVKDPVSLVPDPSLAVSGPSGHCFDPTNTQPVVPLAKPVYTQGQAYAALSCQSFGTHTFAYFWNDMGGGAYDDTDYGNATLIVSCAGTPSVQLID